MSRALLPFRRLRWQLTLSYILITLVAALTLEVATTVVGVVAPHTTPNATPSETLVNAMHFTEAQQLVPYLEQTLPDQHGLAIWASIWTPGFTFSKQGFVTRIAETGVSSRQIPLGSDGASNVSVVVVSRDGKVLASASSPTVSTSSITDLITTPQAQTVLHSALLNGKVLTQASILADGRTVASAAVTAYDDGPVLGALLVAATIEPGPTPPTLEPFLIDQIVAALKSVLPSAFVLVLFASIIGTLFGLLTSGRITRRLGGMTQAADAWSRGELAVVVDDHAPDELGRLAQNLDSMAGQLRRLLTERQQLAIAEERNRLARDLHDSVKQRLFAVTMLVGSARVDVAEWPEIESTLAEAEQVARQAQRELTGLIKALRPLALAGKGLSAAVRELCDDWSQRTGIPATVQLPDVLPLTASAEQGLYHVVEEALSNIARHSGATRVAVSIANERDSLLLRIEDDGRGFDVGLVERQYQPDVTEWTDSDGQGLGLRSMRERVEGAGGVFKIVSVPTGTCIEVRVPLLAWASSEHVLAPAASTTDAHIGLES